MENIEKNISRSILSKRHICLFCIVFLLYIFCGFCISYQTTFDTDIFFGADNSRAFRDLTNITNNHYRIKVHPLFLLLAQPLVMLIDGVVNRPAMSVFLLEAFCGALSVCLFDAILGHKKINRRYRNIFTCIYAFSFSNMIFSAIPETFIFAGLGLISFWYFLSISAASKGAFSKKESCLLIFFGIVCFGVTLTNYVFYLIGLVYLLFCRYDLKTGLKTFFKLNIQNSIAVFVACLYQKFVWNSSPLFWESILASLTGQEPYEEMRYMNWSCSLDKTITWLKQTVLNPLLSPDVYQINPGTEYHPIVFSGYFLFIKLILLLFFGIAAIWLIFWVIKQIKQFRLEEDGYIWGLVIAYIGNLVLHYIYGPGEGFLYSPHYLFYIILALALILDRISDRSIQKITIPGMMIFCAVESVNNLSRFYKTAQIALSMADLSVNIGHAVKGMILCGGVLLGILYLFQRAKVGNCALYPLQIKQKVYIERLWRSIKFYCLLLLIPSLFIAFNY